VPWNRPPLTGHLSPPSPSPPPPIAQGTTIEVNRDAGRVTVSGPSQTAVNTGVDRVLATVHGYRACSAGNGCYGFAPPGGIFCTRCTRLKAEGEGADRARGEARASRPDQDRERTDTRSRQRDTKEARARA
jgi:hypothetical protein